MNSKPVSLKKFKLYVLTLFYIIAFVLLPVCTLIDYTWNGGVIYPENAIMIAVTSVLIPVLFTILPSRTVVPKQVPAFLLSVKSPNNKPSGKKRINVRKLLLVSLKPFIIVVFMYFFVLSPLVILDVSSALITAFANIHVVLADRPDVKIATIIASLLMVSAFTYIFVEYASVFKLLPYFEFVISNMGPEDRRAFIKNNDGIFLGSAILSVMTAGVIVWDIISTTLVTIPYGLLKLSISLLLLAVIVARNNYEKPIILMKKLGE